MALHSGSGRTIHWLREPILWAVLCSVALKATGDEATITSPAAPAVRSVAAVFKPGVIVDIRGSANGAAFRQFRVEWARGVAPASGWSNAGVTLAGGGGSPVTNGLLASWNSGAITQADFYSVRLLADETTVTNEARTLVYFEPDLYSTNWPRWLDQAPGNSSALPARDTSGRLRLALVNPPYASTTLPSRLWVFEPDSSSYTTNVLDHGSYQQPAVADLDGTAGEEIIVAEAHAIRVFHPDGSSSVLTPPISANFQEALVVVADLDGDGHPEILALGSDLGSAKGWLFAWRTSGEMFSAQYPLQIPDSNFTLRSQEWNRIVPVDVDADGKPELLIVAGDTSSSFSLRMLRADGTPAPWPTQVLSGTFRQLAVGDLDHDGFPEFVLAYSDSGGANLVQVYSANGTVRPGWPVQLGGGTPVHLALADLNRDGTNEIIATEYADLYVFKPDGSIFPGAWPVQGNSFQPLGIPVAADIDGDGISEILVTRDNVVFASPAYTDPVLLAYRTNGTLARSWRLLGANGNQPDGSGTVLVGDFDGDGNVDLAVNYRLISGGGTSGSLHEGVLTLLRLGVTYRPDPRDWPMHFHDIRNSSAIFTPARLRLSKSGGNLLLSWPRQPDAAVLNFRDDLRTNSWNTLSATVVVSNGLNTVTFSGTNAHRWYRLQY